MASLCGKSAATPERMLAALVYFVERWDGGGIHGVAWFIEKPGSGMVLCRDVTEPHALQAKIIYGTRERCISKFDPLGS